MKESFGTPSFLPRQSQGSSMRTRRSKPRIMRPNKTCRHNALLFRAKAPSEAWQETKILYSRTTRERLSGKISLKCTLGQPFLAKSAYYVRFDQGKRCRRVHFANISPEKSGFSAREYKICESCHYLLLTPFMQILIARRGRTPQIVREEPSSEKKRSPTAIAALRRSSRHIYVIRRSIGSNRCILPNNDNGISMKSGKQQKAPRGLLLLGLQIRLARNA